jgi:hypothetical protein
MVIDKGGCRHAYLARDALPLRWIYVSCAGDYRSLATTECGVRKCVVEGKWK